MKTKTIGPVAIIVITVGIVLTSNEDFKDEIRQQMFYCENVKAQFWPDYERTYETHCTEAKIKEYQNILKR